MTPEEILAWEPFLKRTVLFGGLAPSEIARVAGRMELVSLPKGATLYSAGDEGDALYFIASGQARLIQSQGGLETLVALLGRGESLGEIGLLTGEPRSLTVRLETTCELLKLKRQDFEELLRENPDILLHLSRMLSRRLVETTKAAAEGGREGASSKIISFNAAAGPEDRLLFCLHLGLQLLEQTRRRTVLVDMGSNAGTLARALVFKPAVAGAAELRGINLRDPRSIRSLIQQHPSGLDILSLEPKALTSGLSGGVYLLFNYLRDFYDLVLINMSNELGEVERAVLAETDHALLIGMQEALPQFRQLDSELTVAVGAKKFLPIWLGELDADEAAFAVSRPMTVPWPAGIAEKFEASRSPYAALESAPKALKAVERLARRLGGVQVGLALGSGAALGHSMIGILKAFHKEHIPIDVITGTSMGSVLAGLLALGLEPKDLEDIALGIDKGWVYENLFWDLTLPRSGLFAGQTLLRFLRSYFGTREFDDLEIPFACVATDIESGEEIVLRQGRVAEAIRASCGLPLIFSPMRIGGRYLVDGGLVNPVPTTVLSEMGADVLIAVSLTMPPSKRSPDPRADGKGRARPLLNLSADLAQLKELALPQALKTPNIAEVFFRMIYTMEYEIAQSRAGAAHVAIYPDLSGFSWTEMHRAKELIALGERVAEAHMPEIKSRIPFFADYCKVPLKLKPWQVY